MIEFYKKGTKALTFKNEDFIATPDQIKLAYCKKMGIMSFVSDPDSFSLLIQSNINEEGEPAITHTIREKDGILWFYK